MYEISELHKLLGKYPNKPWSWEAVSSNPALAIEYCDKHPEMPWSFYYGISWNPNLTMEYVKSHPQNAWDWYGISTNSNLTMKFVEIIHGIGMGSARI